MFCPCTGLSSLHCNRVDMIDIVQISVIALVHWWSKVSLDTWTYMNKTGLYLLESSRRIFPATETCFRRHLSCVQLQIVGMDSDMKLARKVYQLVSPNPMIVVRHERLQYSVLLPYATGGEFHRMISTPESKRNRSQSKIEVKR